MQRSEHRAAELSCLIAMTLAYILAVLIGVALGLLGGGGSIITVPVLVYAASVEAQTAVAMALAIVGVTSLAGAVFKARSGLVHKKAALLFSSTGIVGALLGAQLTALVAPKVLLVLFAILMIATAAVMLSKRNGDELPATSQCRPWRCAAAGFGVGAVTGFLGVGGGFLIVPAMVHFGKVPLKMAIGTSLVVIAFNSLAGFAGQLRHSTIDWGLTGTFITMALIGMGAGVLLTPRVPRERLGQLFAWFVIAVGVFVLANNLRNQAKPNLKLFRTNQAQNGCFFRPRENLNLN